MPFLYFRRFWGGRGEGAPRISIIHNSPTNKLGKKETFTPAKIKHIQFFFVIYTVTKHTAEAGSLSPPGCDV